MEILIVKDHRLTEGLIDDEQGEGVSDLREGV